MASMGASADQVVPLRPESADQRALKDYWSVYEAHFDDIQVGIMHELAGDPEIGRASCRERGERWSGSGRCSTKTSRRRWGTGKGGAAPWPQSGRRVGGA